MSHQVAESEGKSYTDLMTIYQQAESNNAALFAEQRSNLLLVAGNHYANKSSKFTQRLREIEGITKTQKLRLTKNHIQRITKTYINNILMYAPSVAVSPKSEAEYSDVKVAQLHNAVWSDIKERHKFPSKTRQWAKDFVEIGECIAKVFFDNSHGKFLGYDEVVDEETGEVALDENEQPIYKQAWTGDLVYERIHGFNLLTDPDARSWEECKWVIYRKMVAVDDLKKMFEDDDEGRDALVAESTRSTYKIFDSASGNYRDGQGLTMVMEHYYRPCAEYPNGYYYVAVENGILFEGELPLGIFPIVYCGFDEASTSARSFSIIKQLRPYQSEVNRAASKIAEHQITLGDDKVILSNGSTMSPGGVAHGVKAIHVTGSDPKLFAGRTGEQYAQYMQATISEMYQISMIEEDTASKDGGQIDPFAILYKSAKQRKPFVLYIAKFEEFLKEIANISLRFAKAYYSDEMLVPAIGKKEYINIAEFRSTEDLGYQIVLESVTDDLESKMGKQLSLNHLIQYAGSSLSSADMGKIARYMPYLNKEKIFEDLTQDFDNWVNDRLAMDRGQWIPPHESDNAEYLMKKIRGRMGESDFSMLPPQSQQMYQKKLDVYTQQYAERMRAIEASKAGFVPSGGFLATIDLYVPDPKDPSKQMRLRLPSESLVWLKDKLEIQGTTQEQISQFDQVDQARLAQVLQFPQGGGPRQMVPQPAPV